jgi:hypothetical protein
MVTYRVGFSNQWGNMSEEKGYTYYEVTLWFEASKPQSEQLRGLYKVAAGNPTHDFVEWHCGYAEIGATSLAGAMGMVEYALTLPEVAKVEVEDKSSWRHTD